MISTLCSLLHLPGKMKKVFFYWTVRDSSSFRLFNEVMDHLYEQDTESRLEIRHFLTSGKFSDSSDLGSLMFEHAASQVHAKTDIDIRLGHRTREQLGIGRPVWKNELQYIIDETEELGLKKSGVFFCGPSRMGNEVQTICSSLSKRNKSHLYFTKETF